MGRNGIVQLDYISTTNVLSLKALAYDLTNPFRDARNPTLLHCADRFEALAAMTLRSRILGSSNGDVILDKSNSLAGHRLSNSARNVFEENYRYSPFEAALDLAVRSVSKARLLARCVPLSV